MNLEKFTQKAQEALLQSQQLASDLHHQQIEPAHLLLALLTQDQGVVPAIVTKVAGSPIALREAIQKELDDQPKVFGDATGQPGLSRQTSDAISAAEQIGRASCRERV